MREARLLSHPPDLWQQGVAAGAKGEARARDIPTPTFHPDRKLWWPLLMDTASLLENLIPQRTPFLQPGLLGSSVVTVPFIFCNPNVLASWSPCWHRLCCVLQRVNNHQRAHLSQTRQARTLAPKATIAPSSQLLCPGVHYDYTSKAILNQVTSLTFSSLGNYNKNPCLPFPRPSTLSHNLTLCGLQTTCVWWS